MSVTQSGNKGSEYLGERMSGLTIVWVNECLGGSSTGERMSAPCKNHGETNVRVNDCPLTELDRYIIWSQTSRNCKRTLYSNWLISKKHSFKWPNTFTVEIFDSPKNMCNFEAVEINQ